MTRAMLVASLALSTLLGGCVLHGRSSGYVGVSGSYHAHDGYGTVYVSSPPPAAVVEYRTAWPGPNYIWIDGFWDWGGYDWYWVSGHWSASRSGYYYERPRYIVSNGRYVYHRGYWRGSSGD